MARVISDDALAVVTIYQEAASEPFEGKVAVAEVIRNRMLAHHESDGSVAGTVLDPFAFSGWNSTEKSGPIKRLRIRSVQIDDADPAVVDCHRAWLEALKASNTVTGALYYYNPAGVDHTPDWVADCEFVAHIGHHLFYRPRLK